MSKIVLPLMVIFYTTVGFSYPIKTDFWSSYFYDNIADEYRSLKGFISYDTEDGDPILQVSDCKTDELCYSSEYLNNYKISIVNNGFNGDMCTISYGYLPGGLSGPDCVYDYMSLTLIDPSGLVISSTERPSFSLRNFSSRKLNYIRSINAPEPYYSMYGPMEVWNFWEIDIYPVPEPTVMRALVLGLIILFGVAYSKTYRNNDYIKS